MSTLAAPLRGAVRFTRPHTVVGTVVSILALYALAAALNATGAPPPHRLATALTGGLAVNIYIVGLNQLADIHIDRINKPWLPLPAGVLNARSAWLLVGGSLVIAAIAAAAGGVWLSLTLATGVVVGTAYSLPPLHLKRHHVPAAAAIAFVRGLVVNLGVFAHLTASGGAPALPPAVLALTAAILGVALTIAWFKDIPDMAGDREHEVRTLTLRLGPGRVITIGVVLLSACYTAVAAAGFAGLPGVHPVVLAAGHAALFVTLVTTARRVRLDLPASVRRFYQVIWLLFYAEYLVFAVAAAAA